MPNIRPIPSLSELDNLNLLLKSLAPVLDPACPNSKAHLPGDAVRDELDEKIPSQVLTIGPQDVVGLGILSILEPEHSVRANVSVKHFHHHSPIRQGCANLQARGGELGEADSTARELVPVQSPPLAICLLHENDKMCQV